jgi:predicted metalloprotease
VVVLAHELGHAVRFRQDSDNCLRNRREGLTTFTGCGGDPFAPDEYDLEAEADCYAGVVTRRLLNANIINGRDRQVAIDTLAALGDKGKRVDPRFNITLGELFLRNVSHGKAFDRIEHFEVGDADKGGVYHCIGLRRTVDGK